MNCQQADKYIYAFCDNTLSPELYLAVGDHIKSCPSCRNKMELTMLENTLLQEELDYPVLSADFNANVLALVQSRYNSIPPQIGTNTNMFSKSYRRINKTFLGLIGTAAVLFLVFLVPGIFNNTYLHVADNASRDAENVSDNLPVKNNEVLIGNSKTFQLAGKSTWAGNYNIDEDSSNQVITGGNTPLSNEDASASGLDTSVQSAPNQVINNVNTKLDSNLPADGQPRTSEVRSYQDLGRSKVISSQSTAESDKKIIPQPSNLPEGYYLVEMNTTDNNNCTYNFKNNQNGAILSIAVNLIQPEKQSVDLQSVDDQAATLMTTQPESEAGAKVADLPISPDISLNSVQHNIALNERQFEVTLSGNISPEEIETLASVITWQ